MLIEALNQQNIDSALELWHQYQQFYKVKEINLEKNRQHLTKILQNEELGKIFLLRNQENYVGFATIYYSFASTIAEQVAILNDLYVVENHRRQGIGKQLIDCCINYLKSRSISIVRWSTAKDNIVAQQLYNHYAKGTEWLIYSYRIN
jgi:ribosomal protein S18 acetylase RimI-like enzyme